MCHSILKYETDIANDFILLSIFCIMSKNAYLAGVDPYQIGHIWNEHLALAVDFFLNINQKKIFFLVFIFLFIFNF